MSQPLQPDDVAARLTTKVMQAWALLTEIRQDADLQQAVKASPQLTAGILEGLRAEIDAWWPELTPEPTPAPTPAPTMMVCTVDEGDDPYMSAW